MENNTNKFTDEAENYDKYGLNYSMEIFYHLYVEPFSKPRLKIGKIL